MKITERFSSAFHSVRKYSPHKASRVSEAHLIQADITHKTTPFPATLPSYPDPVYKIQDTDLITVAELRVHLLINKGTAIT